MPQDFVTSAAGSPIGNGGGEVGELMRAMDWRGTPLGPMEEWPRSLITVARLMLSSRFAMWMGWGSELAFLYNDAYARMTLGKKHPWALGKPAGEVWSEIWPDLHSRVQSVLQEGVATWDEDLLLFLERSGFTEETYHTFSYSPVPNDAGEIAGLFCVVTEETERVVGDRRLASLRELAAALTQTIGEDEVVAAATRALGANQRDLPFTLAYAFNDGDDNLALISCTGIPSDHPAARRQIPAASGDDLWPVERILAGEARVIVPLDERFGALPTGAWDRPPREALLVPVAQPGQERPAGCLIVGMNPFRPIDEPYAGFVELVAGQIASGLANARAYEAERRRAESLAELDRAKTTFFSNVSHEFRTPLTLMLGPAEDALRDETTVPQNRERLELIHRNALRLNKLVNSLLDFSRIEAGRVDAVYEATDLATFTAELASNFRSATEKAGLELIVDAPPMRDTAYVDREMWEKIVLNLLSNAFKHTFEGSITVAVREGVHNVVLEVRDTGIGIPADQLPRLFERFHRVPNARSRTHEGSGIGLALVQELVRLHGGEIQVESTEGAGTTFRVQLPLGYGHLPRERVGVARTRASTATSPTAYVAEAMRWLPGEDGDGAGKVTADVFDDDVPSSGGAAAPTARVLLADDNADMRDYLQRLLSAQGWSVDAVADGQSALDAVRARRPDLVLSDIMMPGLDGFGLLRALRDDPSTHGIPVILVSARSGEESRIEGLEAGADDYLVKPFSARELVARVTAHLSLTAARQRTAHEREMVLDRERAARAEAEAARADAEAANRAKGDFLAAMSHELRTPLNAIAGYAQLLEIGVHGPLSEAQLGAVTRIQRSEQHLLSLINDVLNFAKLEAGRIEYDLADMVLADAIAAVSPMVEPQLSAKGLRYETRLARDLVVRADHEKLQQILLNLLSNAIKFTDRGGVISLTTETRDDTDHRFVFLRVTDTGIGIPRDRQDAVFDPFVQVHRRLTSSTEGTGLGLAISRDLARGMGGDLRVRSVEGQGSTFTLMLPRANRDS